jgi:type I restriction-modification system DNA methylase subunit
MHKDIVTHINEFSENFNMVNKLIVGAYLEFNKINIKYNQLILSIIQGNDTKKVQFFIDLVRDKNKKFDFEDLIELFELTIPPYDVVVNGAVYTPNYIKNYIVNESFALVDKEYRDIVVGDIACGAGAFLYTVAEKIKEKTSKSFFEIFKDNIFGLDISDYSIEKTKILLTLLALSEGEDRAHFEFNLSVDDALGFDWFSEYENFSGFDMVVGNPPYVRSKHLSLNSKQLMKNWEVTKSGNVDLYIPFFEIALKYIKPLGVLGYITVNTFKRSVNARKLREFFKENQYLLSMIDFGSYQVFDKKSTYTSLVFVEKKVSKKIRYEKISPKELNKKRAFTKIEYTILDTHKGWMLNRKDILKNINKIERCGIPLGDKYPIKNGLATLSNDVFIFRPIDDDNEYFYHEDGFKIEKKVCRDIIKPNRLKKESEIEQLKEQIIYPYYKDNIQKYNVVSKKQLVFDEDYFKDNFPYAYKYLENHKKQLLNRDKGKSNKKYRWFEFGRTQALADRGEKLFFPYMAGQPYFVYTNQSELLFYAGYAIFLDNKSQREIEILQIILKSEVFWYYIKHTSKPYSGNFYALAKNYVKDFGVCELTEDEENILLNFSTTEEKNKFLLNKYGIQ